MTLEYVTIILNAPNEDEAGGIRGVDPPTALPSKTAKRRGLSLCTFPGRPPVELRTVEATLARPKSDSLATVTSALTRTLRLLISICITPRE